MQSVLWTKGVMLNPQHLQTQDRYLEDKLDFHLSSLTSYPWGFADLEIDTDALEGGELSVTRAAGLFPDGLVFDAPGADEPPAPKPLDNHWRPDQDDMTVYLAIPEYRRGGRNVTSVSDDSSARYSQQVLSRRDENTGLAEKEILVARKNFRLLAEGESLEGSSSMPVARVVRSPGGEIRLDTRFVPPVIDIAAARHLLTIARRLVEVLAAKSTGLGGLRRERNQSLADFGISDVANFWLLYTVNTHLPVIRHVYEERVLRSGDGGPPRHGRAHPAELYRAMTGLAGALMTFSSNQHPRDLPPYDHTRLSECFTQLDGVIRELLETVVPTNHVGLPLKLEEASIYGTSIDDQRHLQAVQAYLAVKADMDQSRLIEKAPAWIKVASRDGLRDLMKQALPGVELAHVNAPPSSLPVKLGYQYFRLETAGRQWAAIRQSRSLSAWVSSDVPSPELELLLLLPADEGK